MDSVQINALPRAHVKDHIVNHRKDIKNMNVKIDRSSIVKPAEKTPRNMIWLSIMDLISPQAHVPFFYIFKRPCPCHDDLDNNNDAAAAAAAAEAKAKNFFDAGILKEALEKVLVTFYPLAGRFRLESGGRLEVECNEEGVLFVAAHADVAIDVLGNFGPTPENRNMLVPQVDCSGAISSFPLLVAQVTYFKCGGVSLGVAIDHRVVDGFSGFHFVKSWSEIARGLEITVLPFFDRTLLSPRNPPRPTFDHIEYHIPPDKKASQKTTTSQSSSENLIKFSNFKVTREHFSILKAKASREENNNTINYSTYEVLAGHIWKCACIARDMPDDEKTTLYYPVSGRFSRLKPQLPHGFFGNARIYAATSISKVADLKQKPLWYAANHIHETLVKMDNNYLRSSIDFLELQYDQLEFRYGTPHTCSSPNMSITSWVGFPLHGADFGWGPPFYVGPGCINLEGRSYIFGDAENNGTFWVAIALLSSEMEVFEKLFYRDLITSSL